MATPLRLFLQEEGNRLSPPGFPLGPVYVNSITPLLPQLQPYLLPHPSHSESVIQSVSESDVILFPPGAGRSLPRGNSSTLGRFCPLASLPTHPLFSCRLPSSSLPTTGTRAMPPALLGHKQSGACSASSSYKSKCLLPIGPGYPSSGPRPGVPTPGLASIYPS